MSQPNRIHIISFQSPYPANYGGAIDVYYKAKALKENNIYVILHCFEYNGRGMEEELYDIADEVYMYPRKTGLKSFISHKPYTYKRIKFWCLPIQQIKQDSIIRPMLEISRLPIMWDIQTKRFG